MQVNKFNESPYVINGYQSVAANAVDTQWKLCLDESIQVLTFI